MRGSITALPDNLQGYSSNYYSLLTVLDFLFSSLVVCPCVVGYWRGAWELVGIYTKQFPPLISGVISIVIGLVGHGVFTFFQKFFESKLHPDKSRILYYVLSRVYTVCFAFTCVNGWRGPWGLLDIRYKTNVLSLSATTMVGVVALLAIRGLKNVIAPPFIIANDGVKGYFEVMTMFRTPMGERTSLYILDCIFSILIVGTLVVFVWRGVWLLVDLFLFPDDNILSSWSSLILGYLIVAIAFLLQPIMRYICERLTGTARLLVADLFILFALIGTVNVWRGIWNLLDIYFLPENLELSCWITHWVSLIILILCKCSNSLLVRGVYIDAEEPAGKCVVFPCYYLRVILRKKKLKKLNLSVFSENDTNKSNNEKTDVSSSNHVVSINTVCDTVEEHNDFK